MTDVRTWYTMLTDAVISQRPDDALAAELRRSAQSVEAPLSHFELAEAFFNGRILPRENAQDFRPVDILDRRLPPIGRHLRDSN
jgi:hypothetical protein